MKGAKFGLPFSVFQNSLLGWRGRRGDVEINALSSVNDLFAGHEKIQTSTILQTEMPVAELMPPDRVENGSADLKLYRCSIVACVRWETAHITEWLIYYASIGFDHVYLYCNDDEPSELYAEILPFLSGKNPFVTFVHYPIQGQQRGMYLNFLKTQIHDSEWISFLDIDEFLYLPKDLDINAFLQRSALAADVIYFNWLMFGNSGHVARPSGSVLQQYTQHEDKLHPYTKLIVRSSKINLAEIEALPGHFWHDWPDSAAQLRRINVLGEAMSTYYENFPQQASAQVAQPGVLDRMLAEGVICHFCMKSEDDFERRVLRGTSGEFAQQRTWGEHRKAGEHLAILARFNEVHFAGLRNYWNKIHSRIAIKSVMHSHPGQNLAQGKRAWQSSVSQWSIHPTIENDAQGAVNGVISGRYQFHTDNDQDAWWQIDLGQQENIGAILLYNRLDAGKDRSRNLTFSASDGGVVWREFFRKADDVVFGGSDGFPFRWMATTPMKARFLRISLIGQGYLHLDQVEVYPPDEGT